jgi:PTS system mannitol-specific IIC component
MGILLAYMLVDKKQRANASSSSVIHFFGGIHEVYFPFVILKPILALAAIAGGVVGVSVMQIFGAGAVAPASPGSVIALFGVSAKSGSAYAGLALGIASSLATSFAISVLLLKFTSKSKISKKQAIAKMTEFKGKKSKYVETNQLKNKINMIVFACDAGMGSSVMGAGILRKIFKENNLNIKVINSAIDNLKNVNADLIIVHKELSKRAKEENNANQMIIENFLDKKQYEKLYKKIVKKEKK